MKNLLKLTLTLAIIAIALILIIPSQSTQAAETSTFIGTFDGSEQITPPEYCGISEGGEGEEAPDFFTPYDVIGPIQVSITGSYSYTDLSIDYDIDMWLDIFTPTINFLDDNAYVASFDDYGTVVLTAEVDYYFVVTPLSCQEEFGTWEFSMVGPGNVFIVSDNRLNPTLGDTEVILYPAFDDAGNRTIVAYCVNADSNIFEALTVSQADLPASTPAQNTLIASSPNCLVEFWALGSGNDFRYQVNYGPNANGNVIELLFNDFLGADITWTNFNLYDIGG